MRGARRGLVAGVQRVQHHAVLCAHDTWLGLGLGLGLRTLTLTLTLTLTVTLYRRGC